MCIPLANLSLTFLSIDHLLTCMHYIFVLFNVEPNWCQFVLRRFSNLHIYIFSFNVQLNGIFKLYFKIKLQFHFCLEIAYGPQLSTYKKKKESWTLHTILMLVLFYIWYLKNTEILKNKIAMRNIPNARNLLLYLFQFLTST